MKRKLLLLVLSIFWFASQTHLFGDEIAWSGSPNPIPDDGNLYYIDTSMAIDTDLTVNGILEIINDATLSNSHTINVNGIITIYSNAKIENTLGNININYPGTIKLLNGTLHNNANATININSGGSLYNYYGTVLTDPTTDLNVYNGGKYHNVRGNFPDLNNVNFSAGCLFSDGNEINLNQDLDIDWTWTITNKAVINGYGNKITFSYNGEIVIDKDASLLLEDIIINDISGNKIRCIDSNSTLSINKVFWSQDADFTFTKGTIYVAGDWIIQGNNTNFNYQTNQPMNISYDTILHIMLTTFNYNTSTPNLVQFADETAMIHIEDSTLLATQPWTLTNGTLLVTGLGTLLGPSQLNLSNLADYDINGSLRKYGTVLL